MKKLILIALLVIAAGCTTTPTTNVNTTPGGSPAPGATPSSAVPYSVTLSGFQISGFPGIHSAVVAGKPEKLVVFGGRRNGLHGFPGGHQAQAGPAFPRTEANDTVYVLDLPNKKLLGSAPVATLFGSAPVGNMLKIANQFKATNLQYEIFNGWIYVMGGYGPDAVKGTLTTLDYVSAINFEALVTAVINRQPINPANTSYLQHLALAITGGDLKQLTATGGTTFFVLAFGQQYDGEYTPSGGLVNQNYADGVRVFTFTLDASTNKPLTVNFVNSFPAPPGTQQDPENQFHRRDLTMEASVDASGNRRLVGYGGVFKGGRFEGFLNPVFVALNPSPSPSPVTVTPNTAISQLMSQYDTAALQLYDSTNKIMYTTLLGGISYYYWNAATNSLKHDPLDLNNGIDGLPFINSISTLKMNIDGSGAQYLHVGQLMPPVPATCPGQGEIVAPLGGAETKFVIGSTVPQVTAGVITLNQITQPTAVGYLVGGINATQPYSAQGPTCASDMFYMVTINPTQATNTIQLTAPPG